MFRRKPFQYGPLDQSEQQIRLVILHASKYFKDDIQIDLFHVPLSKPPAYEALSYQWGDSTQTSPIHIAHHPFFISASLATALRWLRKKDADRILWIDQLSINQNDMPEKVLQIALMGHIYRSATWDLLWLGPDLKRIHKALPILQHRFSAPTIEGGRLEFAHLLATTEKENLAALHDLVQFFEFPVFQRLWIVQELILAQRVFVVCGDSYIPYETIVQVAEFMRAPMYRERYSVEAFQGLTQVACTGSMAYVKAEGSDVDGQLDLLTVWSKFGWCGCLRPQDKVFALMGVATDVSELGIRADYEVPLDRFFAGLNYQWILRKRNLRILGYAWAASVGTTEHWAFQEEQLASLYRQLRSQQTRRYRLPTWCADFGSDAPSYQSSQFFHHYSHRSQPTSRGLLSWTPACTRLLEKSQDQTQLPLLGCVLDSLRNLTSPTRDWDDSAIIDHYFVSVAAPIVEREKANPKYFNGDGVYESYMITICGGICLESADNWGVLRLRGKSEVMTRLKKQEKRNCFAIREKKKDKLEGDRKAMTKQLDHEHAELARRNLYMHVVTATRSQVFAISSKGYFALVPGSARQSDVLAVLRGGCTPFVLRPVNRAGDKFCLVGPAYVHGFMDGLAEESLTKGTLMERQFVLV